MQREGTGFRGGGAGPLAFTLAFTLATGGGQTSHFALASHGLVFRQNPVLAKPTAHGLMGFAIVSPFRGPLQGLAKASITWAVPLTVSAECVGLFSP